MNINPNIKAIMDTVLDGLLIIDDKGLIQAFNPAASKIFGYTEDDVLDQNVKMLMPNPYQREHDQYLKNYVSTRNAQIIGKGREVAGRRKNGEVFPMELGVNEMRLQNKLFFVGMVRDISARKKLERDIMRHIAALNQSNKELSDFAHIASHDLKEPLRGLSNNALFLQEDLEGVLDESSTKRLNRMMYLCERMESLIDNLLQFSQLGQQNLAIKPTNLNNVVIDMQNMFAISREGQNIEIIVPQPLPTITCDAVRVTELFHNLIKNAIKYNDKECKKIEIGFQKMQPSGISFYVKDNGVGIPKQFHDDVFRIFKRLNKESDGEKGSGVGLTFVKKIVERHGGKIWIESEPDQGTTFHFTLNGNHNTLTEGVSIP